MQCFELQMQCFEKTHMLWGKKDNSSFTDGHENAIYIIKCWKYAK